MPTGEFVNPLYLRQAAKKTCVAHLCPQCGTDHHVSVEQELRGDKTVTWCHCRACGHSWHPVVQEARES
jgi:DNA-directed RNA polymerase subunit M/transcription elongation factor TFIIS